MVRPASDDPRALPTDLELDPVVVHRRALRVLVGSQMLSGAGLAAGVTVGALLAEEMMGSTTWAGLPAALFTLGSAVAAVGVGRLSQRSGRRVGLATGYTVGALGGALVVVAAALDSVILLLPALALYGSGTATSLQARYAGADLAPADRRGRAVSTVLVATTLGAVIGPNLVGPMGDLAAAFGIRALAGPFLLATLAYALAAGVVSTRLRPDPLLTARSLAAATPQSRTDAGVSGNRDRLDLWSLRLGATAMVVTQLVMVAIMTMTPIHMRDSGHSLTATGFVISVHIAAMYLPSPLSGWLVDRVGRRPVIGAAGVVLLSAGAVAAWAPPGSVPALATALGLLGLGWNLGLVGGTAMLTDALPLDGRARTQGNVDVGVALAGAGGGLGSGLVVATAGYAALGLTGGVLALVLLPALLVGARPARAAESLTVPGRSP